MKKLFILIFSLSMFLSAQEIKVEKFIFDLASSEVIAVLLDDTTLSVSSSIKKIIWNRHPDSFYIDKLKSELDSLKKVVKELSNKHDWKLQPIFEYHMKNYPVISPDAIKDQDDWNEIDSTKTNHGKLNKLIYKTDGRDVEIYKEEK